METILDQDASRSAEHKTLEDLCNGDYKIDLSKYMNKSFEIFQKEWALFGAYTFVMILIFLVSIITIIGPILIAFPLAAGYHIACRKIQNGETLSFSDFFGGFSKFGDFVVLSLIQFAIIVVPSLAMGIFPAIAAEMGGDAGAVLMVFTLFLQLIFYVLIMAFTVLTYFSLPLILYGELSPSQALKYSFRIAKKNFWWILLVSLLAGIFAQIGVIACGIGLFFTAGFTEIFRYLAYEDVFGLASRRAEAE